MSSMAAVLVHDRLPDRAITLAIRTPVGQRSAARLGQIDDPNHPPTRLDLRYDQHGLMEYLVHALNRGEQPSAEQYFCVSRDH